MQLYTVEDLAPRDRGGADLMRLILNREIPAPKKFFGWDEAAFAKVRAALKGTANRGSNAGSRKAVARTFSTEGG